MDLYTFIASLAGSLVWPCLLAVAFLVLRRPILDLLSPDSVTRLAVNRDGVEVTRQLSEAITRAQASLPAEEDAPASITADISTIAAVSPAAAILTSAGRLEGELREMVTTNEDRRMGLQYVINMAAAASLIGEEEFAAANELVSIRDQIATAKARLSLSPADALRYDHMAQAISSTAERAWKNRAQ